mmetsp:Transcript_41598/g.109814  ORF Transcript_41598/g.109814 Transcript_41598/m.109814 type:complete len:208 (+) Transcript_41598:402-1025(+)
MRLITRKTSLSASRLVECFRAWSRQSVRPSWNAMTLPSHRPPKELQREAAMPALIPNTFVNSMVAPMTRGKVGSMRTTMKATMSVTITTDIQPSRPTTASNTVKASHICAWNTKPSPPRSTRATAGTPMRHRLRHCSWGPGAIACTASSSSCSELESVELPPQLSSAHHDPIAPLQAGPGPPQAPSAAPAASRVARRRPQRPGGGGF